MSRGYAAEFGLVAAKGLDKIEPLLPALAKALFATLAADYAALEGQWRGRSGALRSPRASRPAPPSPHER